MCWGDTPDLNIPDIKKDPDAPMPNFASTPSTNYQDSPFITKLGKIMDDLAGSAAKYSGVDDELLAKRQRFGSPAYAAEQIAAAKSDVNKAFGEQRATAAARDASMGLDPSNPRSAVNRRVMDIAEAGASAGAGTMARKGAEAQDWATLNQVAGRGDAKLGQAIGAGQVGGNQYMEGQGLNSRQLMSQNDILSRIYMQGRDINSREYMQLRDLLYGQNKYQQDGDAAGWSGIGSIIGGIGGIMFSSRKLKRDIKPVGEDALEASRKMPAKRWRYIEGGPDDQEHVGPMAEDTAEAIGGNGVTINPADVAGVALAATQQLDKKVRRLEARK